MIPTTTKTRLALLLTLALLLAVISSRAIAQRGQPSPTPVEPVVLFSPAIPQASDALLLYAETVPAQDLTTIWLASPAKLNGRVKFAAVRHLPGYPPKGSISPDGRQVALLVIPSGEIDPFGG